MSKTATITANVEPELKKRTEAIFKQIGLSVSDAVALFLRRVEREGELPPEYEIPNRTTRRVMSDTDSGKNLLHFNSEEEMFRYLRQ
jgi:DNA-damage-inducible protein J